MDVECEPLFSPCTLFAITTSICLAGLSKLSMALLITVDYFWGGQEIVI